MKVVILQPSYIPWRGYFHQIQKSDVFVFYDCVQYDKHGWRNRNVIKTANGEQWLTVPVNTKGCVRTGLKIDNIHIDWTKDWAAKHVASIIQNYSKAPFFCDYGHLIEAIYGRHDKKLADLTCATTEIICQVLGIKHTKFLRSSQLPAKGSKTDRLLSILTHLGASHYISGPSAKDYLEQDKFKAVGITIEFINYDYPEYPQINGTFYPNVSILDLIFNTGSEAPQYIWKTK